LKVPYYLLFEPEKQTLAVFHLEKGKYVAAAANEAGRLWNWRSIWLIGGSDSGIAALCCRCPVN